MKKNKNWKTRLKLLTPFLLLITPVFLIIFGLIVQIISKQNFFSVFSSIHDISLGVNNLAANAAANSSLIFYIIGLGGRALNPDFSFFGNIISSQGIVGVIAYLFLGITSVYFGYKIFRKRLFENRDYKLVLLLLFIMIYSIVMHFFTVPGILTTTLWWISFALISAFSQIDKKSDAVILKDLGYVESKALKVKRINFQYVLVLAIVLFGIGAFVFFSRLVF